MRSEMTRAQSTSWVMISMFGNILVPVNGTPKAFPISKQSPTTRVADKSYWSLDENTRAHMESVIRANGFDPEELATMYGMRDKWNIRFFREYAKGLRPKFERKVVTFF